MPPEDQDRIVVVLVRARNPANIGAVARAMHDHGYTQLRIVNEYAVPFAAAKSAVDAAAVLRGATEPASVAEAIRDCTLVLGTTAVGQRALEHPVHLLADASSLIRETLIRDPGTKIALLFGSEKTGLSNEELSHCHALLTIPMNTRDTGRHLSMNLGQAVAVCLYAIAHAPATPATILSGQTGHPAAADDLERLTSLLAEVLGTSGYTRRHPANARETNLRRLVRRMNLTAADAQVWTGVLRQILYALNPASASHPPDRPSKGDAGKRQTNREL